MLCSEVNDADKRRGATRDSRETEVSVALADPAVLDALQAWEPRRAGRIAGVTFALGDLTVTWGLPGTEAVLRPQQEVLL